MMEPLTPNGGPHRSSIWYYDGSIVLQAENTQFCVHGGVLSDHSTVFRDLLTLPRSTTANLADSVEGRPLVYVSDAAQELAHLLHALYDPAHELRNAVLCYETQSMLCAVLRLSTKYMIAHLRVAAAERFRAGYPSRLENWRSISATLPKRVDAWELDVANTLQACELLAPLLPLLYRVILRMREIDVYRSTLSSANKEAIFEALQTTSAQTRYTIVYLFEDIGLLPKCTALASGKCRDTAKELLKGIMRTKTGTPTAFDPLCVFIPLAGPDTDGVCDACHKRLLSRVGRSETRVWDKIPAAFGMVDWNTVNLRDMEYQANLAADHEPETMNGPRPVHFS